MTDPRALDRVFDDPDGEAAARALVGGEPAAAIAALARCTDPTARAARAALLAAAAIGSSGLIDGPETALLHGLTLLAEARAIAAGTPLLDDTGDERVRAARVRARRAEQALLHASGEHPDDPLPWYGLQSTAALLDAPGDVRDERWRACRERGPIILPAVIGRVDALAPRHGGDAGAVLDQARELVAEVGDGDPVLAALPLAHAEVFAARVAEALRSKGKIAQVNAVSSLSGEKVCAEIRATGVRLLSAPTSLRPDPFAIVAHNAFAAVLAMTREGDAISAHLRCIGDRFTSAPWNIIELSGDPRQLQQQAREKAR